MGTAYAITLAAVAIPLLFLAGPVAALGGAGCVLFAVSATEFLEWVAERREES